METVRVLLEHQVGLRGARYGTMVVPRWRELYSMKSKCVSCVEVPPSKSQGTNNDMSDGEILMCGRAYDLRPKFVHVIVDVTVSDKS